MFLEKHKHFFERTGTFSSSSKHFSIREHKFEILKIFSKFEQKVEIPKVFRNLQITKKEKSNQIWKEKIKQKRRERNRKVEIQTKQRKKMGTFFQVPNIFQYMYTKL